MKKNKDICKTSPDSDSCRKEKDLEKKITETDFPEPNPLNNQKTEWEQTSDNPDDNIGDRV